MKLKVKSLKISSLPMALLIGHRSLKMARFSKQVSTEVNQVN